MNEQNGTAESFPAGWLDSELISSLEKSVSSRLLAAEDFPTFVVLSLDEIEHLEQLIPYLHESEIQAVQRFSHMPGALRHGAGCLAAKVAALAYRGSRQVENPVPGKLPFAVPRFSDFCISNKITGSPYISGLETKDPVFITISHSRYHAVAAAWRGPLGIDVEDPLRATEEVWRRVLGRVYGEAAEGIWNLLDDMAPGNRREVASKLWIAQECAFKIIGEHPARIESFRYEPSAEILTEKYDTILIRVNKRVVKVVTVVGGKAVIGLGADITEIL